MARAAAAGKPDEDDSGGATAAGSGESGGGAGAAEHTENASDTASDTASAADADADADGAGPADPSPAESSAGAEGVAVTESENDSRVKAYHLVDGAWEDMGTGFVQYTTGVGRTGLDLDFRIHCEETGASVVSSSTTRCSKYSRQQETLVCWTEPEAFRPAGDREGEFALSFQEDVACSVMWELLCRAKGVPFDVVDIDVDDMSDDELSTLELSMTSTLSDADARFELDLNLQIEVKDLPPPDVAHLKELADEIYELGRKKLELVAKGERETLQSTVLYAYEKYADQMLEKNFIPELIETFDRCEDLEDTESLGHIYRLAHGMCVMCNTSLFEILFDVENILSIIGMFEYPPVGIAKGTPRKHRDYLTKRAGLKEAVPFEDVEIRNQIHLSYRLQYIRDIIFAGFLDDYLQSTLSSFLLFINVDVCQRLADDEKFLGTLFDLLENPSGVSVDGYVERMRLLKELCSFGRNLNADGKHRLFMLLNEKGLFRFIQRWLGHRTLVVRQVAIDILMLYNQSEAALVRSAVTAEGGEALLKALADAFVAETSATLLPQIVSVLRCIVDTESAEHLGAADKTKLLSAFYETTMAVVLQPLDWDLSIDEGRTQRRHEQVNHALCLLAYVLPLHTYHVKNFVLRNPVLQRTSKQLRSRSVVIELAATRVLRTVIGLRNEFYNRHMVKHDLLGPVIERLLSNGDRYNMLNSCILELIDFIRKENLKTLVAYMSEKHAASLREVTYVSTARDLLTRHEQNTEVLNLESTYLLPGAGGPGSGAPTTSPARDRRDVTMDAEEENYWDDEETESGAVTPLFSGAASGDPDAADADDATLEPASDDDHPPPTFRKRLVNYADDDDDDALFALTQPKQQKVDHTPAVA